MIPIESDDPSRPGGLDPPSQIRAVHLAKLAIVYVRQSSPDQVREHTGSTAAQRALADLPRSWGWPESRILLIDEDLGLSGTSSSQRAGFLHVLDLIDRGEVGIVLVREGCASIATRLGRAGGGRRASTGDPDSPRYARALRSDPSRTRDRVVTIVSLLVASIAVGGPSSSGATTGTTSCAPSVAADRGHERDARYLPQAARPTWHNRPFARLTAQPSRRALIRSSSSGL
jgi:hypothetical protein